MDISKRALLLHRKLAGKITVSSKIPVRVEKTLSAIYTPGVGVVSSAIVKNKELVWKLTGRGNSVAIITNGTAVLGLGNIGPEAALPVMEGKAALFSELADINAFPLCLATQNPNELTSIVRTLTPSFGAINLEDIKAPECFEIEQNLQDLGIPVFHDDQDGAAIVVLAGLWNATKTLKRNLSELRIVIMGAGAAASATTWLLLGREKWHPQKQISNLFFNSPKDIILLDSKGILEENRTDLTSWKKMLTSVTNKEKRKGGIREAIKGADVFIGLSTGGKLDPKLLRLMHKKPIVFALSNPIPEIMPDIAKKAGAALVATGRSDFPNQVNNALVFPGLFRGLLDAQAKQCSPKVILAAAQAIAAAVTPSKNKILPTVLNKRVHQQVANAVKETALK